MSSSDDDDDARTDSWPVLTEFFAWAEEEPAPYLPRPVAPAPPLSPALVDVVRKPAPDSRIPPRPALAAAAAAALAVIILIGWSFIGGDSQPDAMSPTADVPTSAAAPPTAAPTASVSPPPSQVREFNDRLLALLPSGYPPGVCRSAAPPPGALSMLDCGANADAPAPTTARYTLFSDGQTLAAAMDQLIAGLAVQICPGNYASPGPWRKTATPEVAAGTLVCGTRQNTIPTVGWTLDSAMMLAVIQAAPPGRADLEQLYTWWSTHS
jgi:serine/threonine-protein kinase